MHWDVSFISDVTWDHWVFRVFQHQTASPRRPSWGWSDPSLRPSSNCPTEFFAEWMSCKPSTAHLYRLMMSFPAPFLTFLHQLLVLCTFFSLASSIRSSQDTVISSTISCFVASETIIMSGLSDVKVICWGELQLLPQVGLQPPVRCCAKETCLLLCCPQGSSPALTKLILFFRARWCLPGIMALHMLSETALST